MNQYVPREGMETNWLRQLRVNHACRMNQYVPREGMETLNIINNMISSPMTV